MITPLTRPGIRATALLLAAAGAANADDTPGAFQATGFKVGEVTPDSAIVWTRITARPERNPIDAPDVVIRYVEGTHKRSARKGVVEEVVFPPGASAADLPGAAPGAPGETLVRYRPAGSEAWTTTAWGPVDPRRDFTRQIAIDGLMSGTLYELEVEARGGRDESAGSVLQGGFRTASRADQVASVVFTVVSCQGNYDQDTPDGFKIFESMLTVQPDFFVHTGDILYYDRVSKTLPLARYLWHRKWSWPHHHAFYRQVASYFEKDDHDTWVNDCWPTMDSSYMHEFTFAQGLEVFREQVPMGERTYRTFRWGRDLQVWLVEGRDFRSPNNAPDGPDKTIWGAEQLAWFERTVRESDATFRVLISPTPVVGPDRSKKCDNHANDGFRHEGARLRRFLASQPRMVVVCGDRHWQYHSVDLETGLREYGCGAASDAHAGGWSQDDFVPEYHRYLKVKGGFLSGTVERVDSSPRLTLRFHDVDGGVRHTDVVAAD